MNPSWRFSYTYPTSDLNEYLKEIKSGEFIGIYDFLREVLLQSHERGLIRLPENFIPGDAHRIAVSEITFLDPPPQHNH
jgi:hypothetical protein